MFTGLIQNVGTVERVTPGAVTDLWVSSTFDLCDFALGESISCDGVCLTVVDFVGPKFKVQAAPETLRRSTLGRWVPGTKINLERALRVGDRLGGHWVQGHVDAVGTILETRPEGGSWVMQISLPASLSPFFIEKGSVCLDGTSLTVTRVEAERFAVMLIPETQSRTSLRGKAVGAHVNIEADVIGKYVARMIQVRSGAISEASLKAAGFD